MLLLATSWFGSRTPRASDQLLAAAELGFGGLAGSRAAQPLHTDGLAAVRTLTGLRFHAIRWGAAAGGEVGPMRGLLADGGLNPELAEAHLRVLRASGADHLTVPGGLRTEADLAERGERLLARMRSGEPVSSEDEALHPFQVDDPVERERALVPLVRFLHDLLTRAPGLRVSIATPESPAGLPSLDGMLAVLEELTDSGVGYWHDLGAAHLREQLGFEAAAAWLDRLGSRIHGVTLQDAAAGQDRLLPGDGECDFQLVSEYLPREALRVISVAPSYPSEAVLDARAFLRGLGLG